MQLVPLEQREKKTVQTTKTSGFYRSAAAKNGEYSWKEARRRTSMLLPLFAFIWVNIFGRSAFVSTSHCAFESYVIWSANM